MKEFTKGLIIGKKYDNGVLKNYILDIKSFGNATGGFYTAEEVSKKVIEYANRKNYKTLDEIKNDKNVVFLKEGQSFDKAYCEYLERVEGSGIHVTENGKHLLENNKVVMMTSTNVGRIRKNNEDSATSLTNPNNPNVRLLAVADGMGGGDYGELASSITIESLSDWFLNLKASDLINKNTVVNLLNTKLLEINFSIQHKANFLMARNMGTTLAMALVLENDTILANIGDSRVYATKGTNLKQLTQDNSISWDKYKKGLITKDQIRFDSENNKITKALGLTTGHADFYTMSNDNYDKLLLFTDGVTDILSDNKIKFITNTTSPNLIADEIINEAVNVNQNDGTCPGKDNTTVAVYIKK